MNKEVNFQDIVEYLKTGQYAIELEDEQDVAEFCDFVPDFQCHKYNPHATPKHPMMSFKSYVLACCDRFKIFGLEYGYDSFPVTNARNSIEVGCEWKVIGWKNIRNQTEKISDSDFMEILMG